jgi:tetratricopeptide (TPR) repeat protein
MLRLLFAVVFLALINACTTGMPKMVYSEAEIRDVFLERLSPEEQEIASIPFTIPDSIVQNLRFKTRKMTFSGKLDYILESLTRENIFALKYREGVTHTANELLEEGYGNCIAFSHLMIGVTRKMGIESNYVYIVRNPTFTLSDHAIIVNYHMMVGIADGPEYRFYDFRPGFNRFFTRLNGVDDLEGIALHYNNLGAWAMQIENFDLARRYLSIAHKLAPQNSEILSNYGLYFLRTDDPAMAKIKFKEAINQDEICYPAWHNLFYVTLQEKNWSEFYSLKQKVETMNAPTLKVFLANLAYQNKEYASTLNYLRAIDASKTRLYIIDLLRAQAYFQLQDYQRAKEYLTKYRVQAPEDMHALILETKLKKFE